MATQIRVDSFESYFPQRAGAYGNGRDGAAAFNLLRTGALLKQARTERGLSLDEVAESLFIRKSTLTAMESGRWESLPHAVYVKGYVKLYASYLGVPCEMEGDGEEQASQVVSVSMPERPVFDERREPMTLGRVHGSKRKTILACSSLILLIAAFILYPAPLTPLSPPALKEVSMGFFDADHSITHVRKVFITYSDRPWLYPFATTGETRTMILDLPETDPMTHNDPPTERTRSEG